jgi:hypothetical protein
LQPTQLPQKTLPSLLLDSNGLPASLQVREFTESDEPWSCVWNQFGIPQLPLLGEHQRSHTGEDQHEEMIKKVPHIEKEEVLTVFQG